MVTVTETNPRCSELEDVEGGVTMKKVLALLALGIVGTVLVRQYQKQKGDRFANGDIPAPGGKNFGMFPPEIPEEQFEGFAL